MQRKVDRRADLLGALAAAGAEALEVDDEKLRRAGDGDLLGGFALFLATRAFPDFVAR